MSVLDILIHKVGACAAKIRLDSPKEFENDAVVSVYSDYLLDLFDDESPQDKTTCEEDEKEEAELEEAEEAIWLSCSVRGVCTKSSRWVISMSSPWSYAPLMRYNHNRLRFPNT